MHDFGPRQRFPNMDPVANPENRTITVHEGLFGGVFINSTYRWNCVTVKLVVENGRFSGRDRPDCGFTDYCSKAIVLKCGEPPTPVCP